MSYAALIAALRKVPRAAWIGAGLAVALMGGLGWAMLSAKESGRNEIRTEVKIDKADNAVRGAELGRKTAEIVADETSDLAAKRRRIDMETSDAIESIRLRVGAGTLVDPALVRLAVCADVRLRNEAGESTPVPEFCDHPQRRAEEPLRSQR